MIDAFVREQMGLEVSTALTCTGIQLLAKSLIEGLSTPVVPPPPHFMYDRRLSINIHTSEVTTHSKRVPNLTLSASESSFSRQSQNSKIILPSAPPPKKTPPTNFNQSTTCIDTETTTQATNRASRGTI